MKGARLLGEARAMADEEQAAQERQQAVNTAWYGLFEKVPGAARYESQIRALFPRALADAEAAGGSPEEALAVTWKLVEEQARVAREQQVRDGWDAAIFARRGSDQWINDPAGALWREENPRQVEQIDPRRIRFRSSREERDAAIDDAFNAPPDAFTQEMERLQGEHARRELRKQRDS